LVTKVDNIIGGGGTRAFGAPEQLDSQSIHNQSHKSDLFAIGRTIYYIMTGKILSEDCFGKISKINSQITHFTNSKYLSLKISAVISRLTVNNPKKRYPNSSIAITDISNIFKDEEQIVYYDAMLRFGASCNINDIPNELFHFVKSYYGWNNISQVRMEKIRTKVKEYRRSGLIRLDGRQYSLA
jgi:serine/threonine protein kinase